MMAPLRVDNFCQIREFNVERHGRKILIYYFDCRQTFCCRLAEQSCSANAGAGYRELPLGNTEQNAP
jgi:hypothetical protein